MQDRDAQIKAIKAQYRAAPSTDLLVQLGQLYAERDGMWCGPASSDEWRFSKAWRAYQQAADAGNADAAAVLINYFLNAANYRQACGLLCKHGDRLDWSQFAWFSRRC